MNIAIFGLGYVGLTSAGCLVKLGHSIVGFDTNEDKCKLINSGSSPIYEPGLEDLLSIGLREKRFAAFSRPAGQLDDCDLALVCVGTPSHASGAHNMTFIAEVSRQIAQLAKGRTRPLTVAYRSTVRPGTMEELVAPFFTDANGYANPSVEIVYNPEFLRESSAIEDFFTPPKIVIGTADGKPSAVMEALYAGIEGPRFITRYKESELTKFVDNSFHALKVVFANEIGRVCANLGVSAQTVHKIFVADTKLNISPRYLRPGGPFGGSCLPKDVRALSFLASEAGANTFLIDSLLKSNEAHKSFLEEKITRGLAPEARILLVGLAFKANSDDLRESPYVDLAHKLIAGGYKLSIYDPVIDPRALLGANLGYAYSRLPALNRLLVSRNQAESQEFDLIVDANGQARKLNLRPARYFSADALA